MLSQIKFKTKFLLINSCSLRYFSAHLRINKKTTCYYKILNVPTTSSFEEIKEEYYKLAKKFHPDMNNNSSSNQIEKFKQISEAYDVLSDPIKRMEYDKLILGIIDKNNFSKQELYEYYQTKIKKDIKKPNSDKYMYSFYKKLYY